MASTTDSNNQSKRVASSGAAKNGTTINGTATTGAATNRAGKPANAASPAAVEPDMNGRADPNRTEEAVSSAEAEPVPQVGNTSSDDISPDDAPGDAASSDAPGDVSGAVSSDVTGDLIETGSAEVEKAVTEEVEADAAETDAAEADTDVTKAALLPEGDSALQDSSRAVEPAPDPVADQAVEQIVVETETGDDAANNVENDVENDAAHDDAGLNEEAVAPAVVADEDGMSAASTGDVEADAEEATASEAVPSAERVERLAVIMNAVKIRGRPGGVAIEIGEGDWSELLEVLQERLEIAEGFFRGGRVVLDVGNRAIDETELRQAFEVLEGFEMQMAVVRSDEERTLEAAVALGVTASAGEAEDPMRAVVESHVEELAGQAPPYFVHEGNLRSGQVLQREESIIVIGDVNPGAQVISHGDVLIWGRLRGSVHAGAEGNLQAMVTALEFAPTQLRIAKLTSVPPEEKKQGRGLLFWKKDADHGAEFAYVSEDRIYVEPWNSAKPGSLTSRRR